MSRAIKVEKVTAIKISSQMRNGKFTRPKFYHTARSAADALAAKIECDLRQKSYFNQNHIADVYDRAFRRSFKIFKQVLP